MVKKITTSALASIEKALERMTVQIEYYVALIRKRTTRSHTRVNRLTRRVTEAEKLLSEELARKEKV
jgi:hypothetical protein